MIVDGHAYLGHTVYIDYSIKKLISDMIRLDIAKTVVSAPPPGPYYDESNEYIKKAVKRYNDRLIALFKASPQNTSEAKKVRYAIEGGFFSGIKLDPTNDGYSVGSSIMDPIADLAKEFDVPIYIHSGDSIFCPPEAVARYALNHPDIIFVTSKSRRAPNAARDVENLYLLSRPFPALSFQRGHAEKYPLERLIFSTDAPLGSQDVELTAVKHADLDKDVYDLIMGGNLLSVFP